MFKLSYVFLVITYNLFLYLMYNNKHRASYLIVVYNFIDLIVVNFFIQGLLCLKCHSILSSMIDFKEDNYSSQTAVCKTCDSTQVQEIGIPHIFRYLCTELAAINIKLQFHIEV